jgi:flagellar P-ring protein precursor FlgI
MLSLLLMGCLAAAARAERIKDIVHVKGVRGNPLLGYGLVVGLKGTGDGAKVSRQALASILRRSGVTLSPDDLTSKNIASVFVTAELPPFARRGSRIDVTVSTIGSATSLEGGTLLLTELRGADKQVYAVCQGNIAIGGFSASGEKASVSKGHPTVGRIPDGATVEREEVADYVENGKITLQLRNPDFTTAVNVAKAINDALAGAATATDKGTVTVKLPGQLAKTETTRFVHRIGQLKVEVDSEAVVVINERTGTVIVGKDVTISTVAIAHGNLSIVTQEREAVSQPLPLSKTGTTTKVQRTEIDIFEGPGRLHIVPKPLSVSFLARALNAMGMTPRDLIAIFQALKKQGALQAKLVIM